MSEKDIKVVNFSDNPNLKLCTSVKGLVVEDKILEFKDSNKISYKEYSIVVEAIPNVLYLRCVVKLDSKQKQMLDQMNCLSNLDDNIPWNIK